MMRYRWILVAVILMGGVSGFAQTATTTTAAVPTAQQVAGMQKTLADWANLKRYAAENAAVGGPKLSEKRVVFLGDSITDGWGHTPEKFFAGKPYLNRGISGQTTPQMLVRFMQDVVHLHPAVVVILAGTNDIAGNTGPETVEMIEDNFAAMNAIAHQYGIKVVMASITPAYSYPWKPGVEPVAEIKLLNLWLKTYCGMKDCTYLDYYSAMADEKGAMKPGLASDGVHPTAAGYAIMAPLAEEAIGRALKQ